MLNRIELFSGSTDNKVEQGNRVLEAIKANYKWRQTDKNCLTPGEFTTAKELGIIVAYVCDKDLEKNISESIFLDNRV